MLARTLYLQGQRAGQARLEPSIKIDQLPMEIPFNEIVAMHKSYEVMSAYFSGITSEILEGRSKANGGSNISSPGSWTP
jgi:hypothetical protein